MKVGGVSGVGMEVGRLAENGGEGGFFGFFKGSREWEREMTEGEV